MYITRAAWFVEGDNERLNGTSIIVTDDSPVPTGLLDCNGNRLYRVPEKLPVGFYPMRSD